MLPLIILADVQPEPQNLGLLVLGIGQLVGIAASVVAIIAAFRRQPPIGEQLHQMFLPRAEHAAEVQRLDGRISESFEEISRVRAMHTQAFGSFERAVGRVEGKLDSMK